MMPAHGKDVHSTPSPVSLETDIPAKTGSTSEKVTDSKHVEGDAEQEDDYSNLKYPEPWKYEKWFLGSYGQKRMLKFKKPKSMYYAINLFAGTSVNI